MSFEDALKMVKKQWHDELKPYWKGGLSLEDVSDFMRKMRQAIIDDCFVEFRSDFLAKYAK